MLRVAALRKKCAAKVKPNFGVDARGGRGVVERLSHRASQDNGDRHEKELKRVVEDLAAERVERRAQQAVGADGITNNSMCKPTEPVPSMGPQRNFVVSSHLVP